MIVTRESAKHLGIDIKERHGCGPGFRQRRIDQRRAPRGARGQDRGGHRLDRRGLQRQGTGRLEARPARLATQDGRGLPRRRAARQRRPLRPRRRRPDPGGAREPDHERERAAHSRQDPRRRRERARRPPKPIATFTNAGSSSCRTSWRTAAASRPRTSSGSRIATGTSGPRRRSTSASRPRCARPTTPCCRPQCVTRSTCGRPPIFVAINRVATVTRVRGIA